MRIVVAPDSFGSDIQAATVAEVFGWGWDEVSPEDELIEVRAHERSNRHRATILNRVEQLLSSDPSLDAT